MDSTRWSVVLAVRDSDSKIARKALETLCELYWYPVYAYIRRRSASADEAQDLTQEFFAKLLEKNYVATADRERGRFRAFLLTAVKHFLSNEWQKQRAQKRGGGRQPISLDWREGERRYSIEPSNEDTPEALFDKQWAITLVNHVLEMIREEFAAAGKESQFDALKGYLAGRTVDANYTKASKSLGMSEGAIRVAVHRMRKRYRSLLRREISETVSEPGEVDDEIRRLFSSLGS